MFYLSCSSEKRILISLSELIKLLISIATSRRRTPTNCTIPEKRNEGRERTPKENKEEKRGEKDRTESKRWHGQP